MEKENSEEKEELKNGSLLDMGAMKMLRIDEILEKIGQIGKLQLLILAIFSFSFMVPGYEALITVFIGQSPPWRCGFNTTECNSNQTFSEGDNGYEDRCTMDRGSWEFTEPKHFSVVTEVRDRLQISFMILSEFLKPKPWLSDNFKGNKS